MKFKTERKTFTNMLEDFLTKGRLGYLSKPGYQIVKVNIVPSDNGVTLVGYNISANIYARVNIFCQMEEYDKTIGTSDILTLLEVLKEVDGDYVTITITNNSFTIDGETVNMEYPITIIEPFEQLLQFDERYVIGETRDVMVMENDKVLYKYNEWFDISNPRQLQKVSKGIVSIEANSITMQTEEDKLIVTIENEIFNKRSTSNISVYVHNKISIDVLYIYPILQNIHDSTSFYYSINNGITKIYTMDSNNIERMVVFMDDDE